MATTETTALAVTETKSSELMQTASAAAAQHEIQSVIAIAKNFPRNEDECFGALMKSCGRKSFADGAEYKFPRGRVTVAGPTVRMAREAARIWGNIRWGLDILHDDTNSRTIKGWAWDLQTNTRAEGSATFEKLVQRKNKETKITEWVQADERDMRELTNRHGSFCIRNCLLQLLPPDLIDDAMATCRATVKNDIVGDVDGARKRLIAAFGGISIHVADLELYLGHELRICTPDEVANLRSVWQSIHDGNSTWSEYLDKMDGKTGGQSDADINADIEAMVAPSKKKRVQRKKTAKTGNDAEDKPHATDEALEGCHAEMAIAAKAGNRDEVILTYTALTNRCTFGDEQAKTLERLCTKLMADAEANQAKAVTDEK